MNSTKLVGLLALGLACGPTMPGTLTLQVSPKMISGVQRTTITIDAREPGERIGVGSVTLSAPKGIFEESTLALDSFGSAQTKYLCPTCGTENVTITATWASKGGEVSEVIRVGVMGDGSGGDGGTIIVATPGCSLSVSGAFTTQLGCFITAFDGTDAGVDLRLLQAGNAGTNQDVGFNFFLALDELAPRTYQWSDRSMTSLYAQSTTIIFRHVDRYWGGSTAQVPQAFQLEVTETPFASFDRLPDGGQASRYRVIGTLRATLQPHPVPGLDAGVATTPVVVELRSTL